MTTCFPRIVVLGRSSVCNLENRVKLIMHIMKQWHVHTEEIVPRKTFILARNQVSSDFFCWNCLPFL